MGTCLFLLGVNMVLLTTIPLGRLLYALASTKHESRWVILLVLPWTTFMELAGIQIACWGLPTQTWLSTDSWLRSWFCTSELIFEVYWYLFGLNWFGLQSKFEVDLIVYPDGKKNTSGQRLPDVNFEDTGIPWRLQIRTLSQTLHTQGISGYTWLPLEVGCYVGVLEVY